MSLVETECFCPRSKNKTKMYNRSSHIYSASQWSLRQCNRTRKRSVRHRQIDTHTYTEKDRQTEIETQTQRQAGRQSLLMDGTIFYVRSYEIILISMFAGCEVTIQKIICYFYIIIMYNWKWKFLDIQISSPGQKIGHTADSRKFHMPKNTMQLMSYLLWNREHQVEQYRSGGRSQGLCDSKETHTGSWTR